MIRKNSTKKKLVFRQLDSKVAEAQFGNGDSWRFKSVTTPGHSFPLVRAVSEFVILQKYGKNVPPLFWHKKTKCPEMREDFLAIEKQVAAMIYRKENITALQLLSIICERFSAEEPVQYEVVNKEKPRPIGEELLTNEDVVSIIGMQKHSSKNMRETLRDIL